MIRMINKFVMEATNDSSRTKSYGKKLRVNTSDGSFF